MNRADRQNRYRAFIRAMSACNNWSRSAIAVGVSRMTAYNWQAKSEEAAQAENFEHELYFEAIVGDGEPRFFSDHIRLGQLGLLLEIETSLMHEAAFGRDEIVRFRGETVFRRDPRFAGMSEEEAEGLGLKPSDLILRDEAGDPVPEMQHFTCGAEKQLAALSAHFPELWGKKSSVEINTNTNQNGVLRIEDTRYARPAQLEVLPDIVEDAVVSEPEPDPGPDASVRRVGQSAAVAEYEALLAMSPEDRANAAAARQAAVVEAVRLAGKNYEPGLPGMSVLR